MIPTAVGPILHEEAAARRIARDSASLGVPSTSASASVELAQLSQDEAVSESGSESESGGSGSASSLGSPVRPSDGGVRQFR